ncbi:glutathione S-transferase [Mycobacterium fragae]|uniref:Glutathione S-transferase n=1 Tax=Mycobacterium fragae TaxID=1260918 RepID=A0A1X1UWH6_9MYCO|nr:glutathione S-transferase [Mycobacterium fragae]
MRQDGAVNPAVLVHLCSADEWSAARSRGELRPESLASTGFIHLSTPEQVHLPANRLYRGRDDLLLLHVDPARLGSPVRWEPGVPTDPESMLFPHLYGPMPVAAVINVTSYRPDADGSFPAIE